MLRLLGALEMEEVHYVLIGAAAMGVHGVVRATEDLDLMIDATAENVDRLRRALRSVYENDPNIDEIKTDDLLGAYPAVRYYPPSGDLYLDILTRLGETASYATIARDVIPVAGIKVVVATPAALYRMKKGTVRPVDHQDAAALRARFGLEDDS